jgi:uncharacterized protein (DUF58 family)
LVIALQAGPSLVDSTAQARRILIRTRRLVDGIFAGHYHSSFKGSGIEFAEVREYVPGDDVRTIDWNVTARLGTPYVKRHVEERELTVMLLVDVSASGRFGSMRRLKIETMARLCGLIAASALRNHDRVGLILFSDRIERFIPPRQDRNRTLRVIHELLAAAPQGVGTDIATALDQLHRLVRRRSVSFLLSDFQAGGYERGLHLVHHRHDLIPVCVTDARERQLPPGGLVVLQDLETGRRVTIDAGSAAVRRHYEQRWRQAAEARRQLFARCGLDAIELDASENPVPPLLRFFHRRERRRREGH